MKIVLISSFLAALVSSAVFLLGGHAQIPPPDSRTLISGKESYMFLDIGPTEQEYRNNSKHSEYWPRVQKELNELSDKGWKVRSQSDNLAILYK